jgi:anhydro-N-acetylmuramic acid kinase
MSGTSLDGIDAALMEVGEPLPSEAEGPSSSLEGLPWELLGFLNRPYSGEQRRSLLAAFDCGGPRELALLHVRMGEWLAETALDLLRREGVHAGEISALGSHGQTVWHEPPGSGERGASLQLGCPATLAERTGIGVVSDFRSRDLAAGGHGAPLVPWADRIFFGSPDGPRVIQNLGGMGNVTWLPSASDPTPLLAFDTGPGVALLNAAADLASGGRMSFDQDGRLAARGRVWDPVLAQLMSHPFFRQPPPRSTGRELFGVGMVEGVARAVAEARGKGLAPGVQEEGWPDVLATLTAFTARSVGEAYRRWVLPRGVREVFLMGGGSRNPVLVEGIRAELAPVPVRDGRELGMDPDAREAASFALLAWAHLKGIPANVPEATGSRGLRVLGSWTPGRRVGE